MQGVNTSTAGPVYMRPQFGHTVSADGLAPDGARPSADTAQTGKSDIYFITNLLSYPWFSSTFVDQIM